MPAILKRGGLTPHDAVFLPLFFGLLALAWLALATWELSPYGHYLDHNWTRLGLAMSLCTSLPGGATLTSAALYVGGWVLMSAAMMLPTTLPLVMIFRRLIVRQSNSGRLLGLLFAGYITAWLIFGLVAHLAGVAIAWLVGHSALLSFNGWAIAAVVLTTAGLFQFSSLKYRCLDACRSPLQFVAARWTGKRSNLESARIGLAHGIYCVGCCWALMLLMFVVGTGSVGWMLALGAVMALEKNSPWGRHLAAPLGLALMIGACLISIENLAH